MNIDKDSRVIDLVGPARIEPAINIVKPSYEEQLVRIQQHALWLKKNGYAESTIYGTTGCFKALAKDTNLMNPEDIKENIAFRPVTNATKEKLCTMYDRFCTQHGIKWSMPRYRRKRKLPYVPMESDIDQLINALSHRQGTFLQLIKETGARPSEAFAVKWIDINSEECRITINDPRKGGSARKLRVTKHLISRIFSLRRRSSYVFRYYETSKYRSYCRFFYVSRQRIARELENPRLLNINFKSLRHWKVTMTYHNTKDLLYVKKILGHRSISSTMIYTHLVDFEEDGQFLVKVARDLDEFTEFLENGFEYISDYDGLKVLRKRK